MHNFVRSSRYSSDVGKMIECPVFHVNGDYPEVSWLWGRTSERGGGGFQTGEGRERGVACASDFLH